MVPATDPKSSRVTHTRASNCTFMCVFNAFLYTGHLIYVSSGLCEDLEVLAGEGFMLVRSLPSSLRKGDGAGDLLAFV